MPKKNNSDNKKTDKTDKTNETNKTDNKSLSVVHNILDKIKGLKKIFSKESKSKKSKTDEIKQEISELNQLISDESISDEINKNIKESESLTLINEIDNLKRNYPHEKSNANNEVFNEVQSVYGGLGSIRKEISIPLDKQGKLTDGVKYVSSFGDDKSHRLHQKLKHFQLVFYSLDELKKCGAKNLVFAYIRFRGKCGSSVVDRYVRISDDDLLIKKSDNNGEHSEQGLVQFLHDKTKLQNIINILETKLDDSITDEITNENKKFSVTSIILEISSTLEMCGDCAPLIIDLQINRDKNSFIDLIAECLNKNEHFSADKSKLKVMTNISCLVASNYTSNFSSTLKEPPRIILEPMKSVDIQRNEGTVLHLAYDPKSISGVYGDPKEMLTLYKKIKPLKDVKKPKNLLETTAFGPHCSTKYDIEKEEIKEEILAKTSKQKKC